MDPVTHTLSGIVLARAFFRGRPAAVPIMAIAANLPDLDAVVHLTGDPAAVLMRRTFGHSILLAPVWSMALALVLGAALRRRQPHDPPGRLFTMALLGSAVHLLLDLINSFGVVLLWPLSDWRPELASVFIIDFVLTGLLAAPLLLALLPPLRPGLTEMSRASLAAVAVYLAFCGANRGIAAGLLAHVERQRALATAAVGSAGPAAAAESAAPAPAPATRAPEFTYVFPEPLGPHRWRGVARERTTYRVYLIHSLTGRVELKEEVPTLAAGDPRVAVARATPLGRRLDHFFKAPVWRVETTSPVAATVYDLRFRSLVLARPAVFQYTIPLQ